MLVGNIPIHLDFYTGIDAYSDGAVEKDILQYLENVEDYSEVLRKDKRYPIAYHLSDVRENILSWYQFKDHSCVLEVGAGFGAITGALSDRASKVVCVELSKRRAMGLAQRHKHRTNIEVIVGNLEDIDFEQTFDYIVLNGVFEYAAGYVQGEDPYHQFLNKVKSLLAENGTILLSIENKYGLKYWSGFPEDHTGRAYDGVRGYPGVDWVKTFSRNSLKKLLNSSGFKTRFYYPFPDYKMPQTIFSDAYQPQGSMKNAYNTYYQSNCLVCHFDEREVLEELIQDGLFGDFANSFLVEATLGDHVFNKILFARFNNHRREPFRLITTLTDQEVFKSAASKRARGFLNAIPENANELSERYGFDTLRVTECKGGYSQKLVRGSSLERVLITCLKNHDLKAFVQEVNTYSRYLMEHMPEVPFQKTGAFVRWFGASRRFDTISSYSTEAGFIDFSFSNCFVTNPYTIIDVEWKVDCCVPMGYILYRSLKTFYEENSKIFTISFRALLSLVDMIPPHEVHLYAEMEKHFQSVIIDPDKVATFKRFSYNGTWKANMLFILLSEILYISKKFVRRSKLKLRSILRPQQDA